MMTKPLAIFVSLWAVALFSAACTMAEVQEARELPAGIRVKEPGRAPNAATQFAPDLRAANLEKAYLRHADLNGAFLTDANLREADLRGADLRVAHLRGADLRGANLEKAVLLGADLLKADLRGANLEKADLRGADLRGANLGEANLRGADLNSAVLRDTIGLTCAQLLRAFGLYRAYRDIQLACDAPIP